MGIVIGLGGIVALLALLSNKHGGSSTLIGKALDERSPKSRKGLPESVKNVVIKHAKGEPTSKTELELAASSAYNAGFSSLGEELLNVAKVAPDEAKYKAFQSPLPTISNDQWTKFVQEIGGDKISEEAKGRFGIFKMGVRRLVDYGLMTSPKKTAEGWQGTWVVPKAQFLDNPARQYKLFARSMVDYRNEILGHYREAIGTVFEGSRATLSGLLGVAHFTGIAGLGKWLRDPNLRKKFAATTSVYHKLNGIF